jgi:hypothetical protein
MVSVMPQEMGRRAHIRPLRPKAQRSGADCAPPTLRKKNTQRMGTSRRVTPARSKPRRSELRLYEELIFKGLR